MFNDKNLSESNTRYEKDFMRQFLIHEKESITHSDVISSISYFGTYQGVKREATLKRKKETSYVEIYEGYLDRSTGIVAPVNLHASRNGKNTWKKTLSIQEIDFSYGERIKYIKRICEIKTDRSFARWIGIMPQELSQLLSGKKNLPIKIAMLFREKCCVTLDWLYFGDEAGLNQETLWKLYNIGYKK